jgi:hypothetical protein
MSTRLLWHVHYRGSSKPSHVLRYNLRQIPQKTSRSKNLTRPFYHAMYLLPIPRRKLMVVLNPLCLVPSTLARIFPDQPPLVTRYIRLIKQKYYETIGETIYCPLDHCRNPNIPSDTESKVVVCTKCRYAFCKLCRCSWHGAGTSCKIQNGYIFTCPSCACRVTFMLLFMFALCAHTDRIVSWRSSWKLVKRKRNECKSCTASKF